MAGFGFGGFIKPQSTGVRPGDVPSFKDLSLSDKLMALGSAFRGDMEGAQRVQMLAAARARQAQQMGLDQELERFLTGEGVPRLKQSSRPAIEEAPAPAEDATGSAARNVISGLGDMDGVPVKRDRVQVEVPSFEVERGERRNGPPNLRDALPLLLKRRKAGIDISKDIDLLDKVGPKYSYVDGMRVDERDPNSPKQIVKVGEGQRRAFDENGNLLGIMNTEGYVQSVADLERAKALATEGAKASYDVGKYDMPDGSTVQMTRRRAVEALDPDVPRLGGPAVAPRAAPDGFGRSQTPAEKTLAEGRAKTQSEVEALTPKARSTLDTLDRKTDFVLDALRKAARQATGGLGGAAGLNALASGIPETAAYDLRSTLDSIEAAVGFDELQQMRDNSPTGGAVGNLTERELSLLASLRGSLKQGQSPEQLQANVERMISEISKVRDERKAAFNRQYGAKRPSDSPAGGYSAEDRARAAEILRQRRAARGGQ